jgi:hypothetical protein
MGRRLFVAHQHVAEIRIFRQRVVERHDRAAGVTEHDLHALLKECPAEDVGPAEGLRHETRLPTERA